MDKEEWDEKMEYRTAYAKCIGKLDALQWNLNTLTESLERMKKTLADCIEEWEELHKGCPDQKREKEEDHSQSMSTNENEKSFDS
jgi:hypothetical protein